MSFNSHSSMIVDLLYHCIINRIYTTTEVYIFNFVLQSAFLSSKYILEGRKRTY